jgi:hypothetical protein
MAQKGADYFYKLATESRAAAFRATNLFMRGIWLEAEECWRALATEMESLQKNKIGNSEGSERDAA